MAATRPVVSFYAIPAIYAIGTADAVEASMTSKARKAEMRAARTTRMGNPYAGRTYSARQLTMPDFTFIDFKVSGPYDGGEPTQIEVYQFDYSSGLEMFVGYATGELLRRVRNIFRAAWALDGYRSYEGSRDYPENILDTAARRIDRREPVYPYPRDHFAPHRFAA